MKKVFTPEKKYSQDTELGSISYTKIPKYVRENTDISDFITAKIHPILKELKIGRKDFETFFNNRIDSNILESDIIGFSFSDSTFNIFSATGEEYTIKTHEIRDFLVNQITGGEKVSIIEARIWTILDAIEWIYNDNDGIIFDGEINHEDVVTNGPLKGKKLQELREILDVEKKQLYEIYHVNNDTHKQQKLLKREINLFTWVGDLYEGGAQYFALGDKEIQQKVGLLIQGMSTHETFSTIIDYNKKINSNWRKSDMVKQVNAKLMTAFYIQTLDHLQKNNASNQDIFHFVRIITWRENIQTTYRDLYSEKTITSKISFDNDMANYDIASKALLYAMHRPGGVFDEIQKTKKGFEFGDPEIEGMSPISVVTQATEQLNKLQPNNPEFWTNVIKVANFGDLLTTQKTYQELSFDEKIQLWAIYRIGKYLSDLSPEKQKDAEVIHDYIKKTSAEAFTVLEEDFNQEFDGTSINLWIANPNFFGADAEDLWLTGDFAEIFSLYQDIHGNSWFFDLHDANQDWFQSPSNIATLGVGIVAWVVALAVAPATIAWLTLAWAGMWLATGITSLITSRKWYDTYKEAIIDSGIQLTYEIISSAAFMGIFGGFLKKIWAIDPITNKLKISVDLLFSRQAWSKAGLGDKFIIFAEVISGMMGNGIVTGYIKQQFPESYFDTDTHHVQNNQVVPKK